MINFNGEFGIVEVKIIVFYIKDYSKIIIVVDVVVFFSFKQFV